MEFIANDRDIVIVGICLGMQLIAMAFDGETKSLDRRVSGKQAIHLTEIGLELLNWKESISVTENHTVSVVKLPPSFDILAYSDTGFEIIKHQVLPIIGVQFHPEKIHSTDAVKQWESLLRAGKNLS